MSQSMHTPLVLAIVSMLGAVLSASKAHASAALDGSYWRVTALSAEVSTLAGDIRFKNGEITGATSCNFFDGTYDADAQGKLELTIGRMTRRGCSGEALDLERQFVEAMGKAARYVRNGESLELISAEGTRVAVLAAMPVIDIEGRRLKIVSYLHEGGLYSIAPDSAAWLRLEAGKLTGATGCAEFSGSYSRMGDRMTVSAAPLPPEAGTSPAACEGQLARQHAAILADLPLVGTFDTNRNLLRLLDGNAERALFWLTPDDSAP
ncbi:MAG: META domain-containing protein [Hyphomicrobiaceae bacterium]|nr:META domain-containing protein [Hyphomicrobiaceae bacterium]